MTSPIDDQQPPALVGSTDTESASTTAAAPAAKKVLSRKSGKMWKRERDAVFRSMLPQSIKKPFAKRMEEKKKDDAVKAYIAELKAEKQAVIDAKKEETKRRKQLKEEKERMEKQQALLAAKKLQQKKRREMKERIHAKH
ncbi:hypothetical protein GQ42DRAFT_163484 [Ramicandelaber brevisporus]|nr:hypothetical protein GQ42DRAFT_163484 [Ramicandelaber brevisporus]